MQNEKCKTKNYNTISPKTGYKFFSFFTLRFAFQNGFTLLETVVALSVILAALVGPVAVVTKSIASFTTAKNRLIAVNLAQEGIELIHVVRENNVLCDQLDGAPTWFWDHDPHGVRGQKIDQTPRQVDASDFVSDLCGATTLYSPNLALYTGNPLKFNSATGLYGYTGTDSLFTRRIDIATSPANPDPEIPAGDQMDITSTVTWSERGIPKNVVLKERIYNWK